MPKWTYAVASFELEEAKRSLDNTNLGYYYVLRSTQILFLTALGFGRPYQHPLIIEDLCDLVAQETGLRIPTTILSDKITT